MSENRNKHSPSTTNLATADKKLPFSLFVPSGTQNYSMRFSIAGHGQIRIALGTAFLPDAMSLAHRKYWEAINKAESGQSPKQKKITDLIADFMKLPKPKEAHQKAATRKIVLERYLTEYVTAYPSPINEKMMAAYQTWRNDYWISGNGKHITHLEYKRQQSRFVRIIKTPVTDKMRRTPAGSSINHENAILREFFTYLISENHLKELPKFPSVKAEHRKHNRPSFADDELDLFRQTTMKRLQNSTSLNRDIRFLFWCFSEIMIDSGLRDTEALHLKWSDIINFTTNTEIKDNNISIKIHGKSKSRTAISNPSIIYVLQALHSERNPSPDDYVFTYKNGNKANSFSSQMNEALKDSNLTTDYRGVKRTCYSFRHYFITKALNNGVPIHLLDKNTGTSVAMIERHYSHVSLERHRQRLIPEHMKI